MTIKIKHHEKRVDGVVKEETWRITTYWDNGDGETYANERDSMRIREKADLLSLREHLNKLNLD